jgi:ABC-2 type transport system ATP-binding protein
VNGGEGIGLEVEGLTKHFPGFLLDRVSFTLPACCIMGFIGPNGAGKTTTLKLILGLLRRDAGTIRAFGLDPARHGLEVRSRIGFVHDEPRFYRRLTLRQNAELVARCYRTWEQGTFEQHAEAFGLPLRKRFGELSHGTKTKFALALALSHGAELMILDEPTSGLDPVFRRELLDTLRGLLQGGRTSILFSTHITSDLERIADYITLIQNGRVVFTATRDEILEHWVLVKGGLELLESGVSPSFRGIRRNPHGFEALTDDVAAVRRMYGDGVVVERASLDELVLYTTVDGPDA